MCPGRLAAAALLAAGCASFDGHTLVPGRATRAEVRELMGPPAEEAATADGGAALYFPRLVSGTTTTKDVRELLGPPVQPVVRFERLQRDVWEYPYQYYEERRVVWVQFSYDGVVQEVQDMLDWSAYPPSGRRRR